MLFETTWVQFDFVFVMLLNSTLWLILYYGQMHSPSSGKKVLFIFQNQQENTSAIVSFLIKLHAEHISNSPGGFVK